MNSNHALAVVVLALVTAALFVSPVASAVTVQTQSGSLGISVNLSPNPVYMGSMFTMDANISGGSAPYFVWYNQTPTVPNCPPPTSQPIQLSSSTSGPQTCTPTAAGTYNLHFDVYDNAGDSGSWSGVLNVQQSNNNGNGSGNGNGNGNGNGSGSGNNNSGNSSGIDLGTIFNGLSGYTMIFVVLGALLLACIVASAVSLVVIATLGVHRLKLLRRSIMYQSGEPKGWKPPKTPKVEQPKEEKPKAEEAIQGAPTKTAEAEKPKEEKRDEL